jgi:hypothetical protein
MINDLHVTSWTMLLNNELNYHLISYVWSKKKPMRDVYVDIRNNYTIKRQGKIYTKLPRTTAGEIVAPVCLSDDDMNVLKADEKFTEYVTYVS